MKSMTEGLQLMTEGSTTSLSKAIEKFEAARPALRSLNLPVGDAVMLTMIGYAYSQLEQNQKAIEKFKESLPLYRSAGEQRGEAIALLHLGLMHTKLGEMETGLDFLDQALALFHSASEHQGEAMALAVIGSLYVSLGKPEELISYYNKVLEISRTTAARESEAVVLPEIAALYKLMGQNVVDQPEKAREGLEQLLSVSRSLRIPRGEALALLLLGLDHSFERETQKALSYYEQALPIFRDQHDRPGEGAALFGICMSHISAREYQKGFDYCAQALALHRAIGDRQAESLTLKQIAIGERDRGDLAASLTAIESAIANVESIRTKVVNPELRLTYFAGSQDYYEFYIDLLMRLHRKQANAGYDGKALHASERASARHLLDTLNEANADIRQGVDAALLQRERETQRRLNAKAQTQMILVSQKHSEAQAKAIAEEIQTQINELRQVETEIRQTSPHYAALMQPRPLTLKEIQTQVLDRDTVLLEYSLGEERSYLWVVTSSSMTSYELAKREEIETAAGRYYTLLNVRNKDVKDETSKQRADRVAQADLELPLVAESLSRMVLAPAAGELGTKRLMIVADGALHFVPFAALPVVSGGATNTSRPRPLLADHEIVNLPSASTLSVVRGEVAGRTPAARSVVVLADPVFMKNDERVKKIETSNSGTRPRIVSQAQVRGDNTLDRQLVKAAKDTGVATEGMYVPRLPGTRQEAEQIVAMVPAAERRLALDFGASRDTATNAELSQYRYVHFSTHGLLNSVHPELSGVVFSLVNERGESQDGFLRAHEIFNLKFPAEVVVLSACQTGIGKEVRGEGLVSLTRGFMHAGAPRVVVSLWDVSDSGTTELMVRFYRGMLKEGMRPAAALRAAQVSLMNDERWASPYYWASFTLQGEWR
ncbi:MAG TPA: CHAT domain-containing tetratricopeptide repeat protein [Pyrinomonadaceae bacterium]|nr:CHAT domain-containing tetratricopeptide repeat protein [Pyrinomonadaceae bacterium]